MQQKLITYSVISLIGNCKGINMMSAQISLYGPIQTVDTYTMDLFPDWVNGSDYAHYTGRKMGVANELGFIGVGFKDNQYMSLFFVIEMFDPVWLEQIIDDLSIRGFSEIYLDFAAMDGSFAGFIDFRNEIRSQVFKRGDEAQDISDELLQVLGNWKQMNWVFEK